jgi:gamma-glutamyl-gamma-aminobutyrate hydrolase PuuD
MFLRRGFQIAESVAGADFLCFSGGVDVNPKLYNEKNIASVFSTERDSCDYVLWTHGVMKQIPIVGFCRGSQFLNVMSGGKMWQDVDGHLRNHYLWDNNTHDRIKVTSTHHQMMRPASDGDVLAVAGESTYRIADNDERYYEIPHQEDIEVVYYKRTNSLCFQPHPEYGMKSCEDYFFHLLETAQGVVP